MKSSGHADNPREAGGKVSASIYEVARKVQRRWRNKYLHEYLHASSKTEDEVGLRLLLIIVIAEITTRECLGLLTTR